MLLYFLGFSPFYISIDLGYRVFPYGSLGSSQYPINKGLAILEGEKPIAKDKIFLLINNIVPSIYLVDCVICVSVSLSWRLISFGKKWEDRFCTGARRDSYMFVGYVKGWNFFTIQVCSFLFLLYSLGILFLSLFPYFVFLFYTLIIVYFQETPT